MYINIGNLGWDYIPGILWLPAVLAAGDYISVKGHVYFQQSEVFRPTSSIELWSELDVDMDTLCGGTEKTHTPPHGVAGRMVVLG